MAHSLTVKDVMEKNVITLSPEMSLEQASKVFSQNTISGAPVVDQGGNLKGVLSQTDLLRIATSDDIADFPSGTFYIGMPYWRTPLLETIFEKLEDTNVEETMNTDVITCSPNDDISVIATTMRHNKIHRVIVVEDQKVVGIVSSLCLLQVLEKH